MEQVYRLRRPRESPLWQCLSRHFDTFLELYEEHYQPRYDFLRSIIPEVVNNYLDCGDLERGSARVRCDHCKHEYLLAFSCKGRWFCPSCHQKKVQLFGMLLAETILYPVPHRHFTFSIPIMLRGWVHSGLNVHRSRRVLPDERQDLERLAQYIIRNPFAVEKMQVSRAPGALTLAGSNGNETLAVFDRPTAPIVLLLVLETGHDTKLMLDQSESESVRGDFWDRSFDKDHCAPRTRRRTISASSAVERTENNRPETRTDIEVSNQRPQPGQS